MSRPEQSVLRAVLADDVLTRSATLSADRVALLILAAVAVVAAMTFRDYGLGWDDYTHSQYGDLLLKLYGSGFAELMLFWHGNL